MPISELSKEQIEQYAKESTNWTELMTKCGYTNFGCRTYLKKKLDILDINIAHFVRVKSNKRYTNEEIFTENSEYTSMAIIKNKLINQYNWKYECSSCKLSEWMGQKIPIEIDHINGNHSDNRFENLRFLCPNCHALTDTYKGKNIKNKEHSKENNQKRKENKICKNCNNPKHKYSQYCKKCHIKIKLHNTNNNKITNKCFNCNNLIQKSSERCTDCYKQSKKKGIFEKEHINTTNMKKCPDCDKFISKKSVRCRLCHYSLIKSKSEINSKNQIKGQCLDCNLQIDKKAIRCINCSNKVIENANNKIMNKCIDCDINIDNKATRCTSCYQINSRKVESPTYEQLLKDKETLSMVKIGKKYNVSDNTIRKWIKKYQNISN